MDIRSIRVGDTFVRSTGDIVGTVSRSAQNGVILVNPGSIHREWIPWNQQDVDAALGSSLNWRHVKAIPKHLHLPPGA